MRRTVDRAARCGLSVRRQVLAGARTRTGSSCTCSSGRCSSGRHRRTRSRRAHARCRSSWSTIARRDSTSLTALTSSSREIEVRCEQPFVPRPDLRGARAADWDEQVADLHYADTPEYATGHGVSADWEIVDGACRVLRTRWIPSAEVEKTETGTIEGVELSMECSARSPTALPRETALEPLVAQYREWIERASARRLTRCTPRRRETAERATAPSPASRPTDRAWHRAARVGCGRARRVPGGESSCGRALCAAARRSTSRRGGRSSSRSCCSTCRASRIRRDPDRDTVDLLFFPTGGGKTEAYLGLAAFAMVLRRLAPSRRRRAGGAGVSVIMRYTLRLLTLDQLARAAGPVCALELEREKAPERYGDVAVRDRPVGRQGRDAERAWAQGRQAPRTPRAPRSRQFKADPKGKPSPIPLEKCPWCGTRVRARRRSRSCPTTISPRELRIVCTNFECDFIGDRPLPIVAVDEPLYRRLPAFLIATVDKFASLPWVGQSGALLGGADRYDATASTVPLSRGAGTPLSAPLPPPDLVIQDELHLISGPLGTMAGLYETAIDALCAARDRRAARAAEDRRVHRDRAPGAGPDPGAVRALADADLPSARARPARLVLRPRRCRRRRRRRGCTSGVAAQGRNPKVVMRKAWLALMGAAERAYRDAGGHENAENPADPYMTVLGYFNSLRELGGARRILEEEVRNTVNGYGARRRIGERARPLPGPQDLLRGRRADLPRVHRQGRGGAPPARSAVRRAASVSTARSRRT